MKSVTVTVTSKQVGYAPIYPYARNERVHIIPIYQVPTYEVSFQSGKAFKLIRFGLTGLPADRPAERTCNVGVTSAQRLWPEWVPGYGPHSFHGRGPRGAWRLFPGKQFLLHEGASNGLPGGSLGCLEVLEGSQWQSFLLNLQAETGVTDFSTYKQKKLFQLVIQPASFPEAIYIDSYDFDNGLFVP